MASEQRSRRCQLLVYTCAYFVVILSSAVAEGGDMFVSTSSFSKPSFSPTFAEASDCSRSISYTQAHSPAEKMRVFDGARVPTSRLLIPRDSLRQCMRLNCLIQMLCTRWRFTSVPFNLLATYKYKSKLKENINNANICSQ